MPMKEGSGNLDFGGDNNDDNKDSSPETETDTTANSKSTEPSFKPSTERTNHTNESNVTEATDNESQTGQQFPYFVRRNKVGDERDDRIEVWLRNEVVSAEDEFRSNLADELGVSGQISKTDAREFALKFAFENPGDVADLMRDEGFGLTD